MNEKTMIRIDKYLANIGIVSRRSCKQFLKREQITVNGIRVTKTKTRIMPGLDTVKHNDTVVKKPDLVYFLLNKPIGVVSTTAIYKESPNVVSLIDSSVKIYPIGRLDKDTRGLILLTNDGELTHKLIHPKYHIPKVYRLTVKSIVLPEQLEAFRRGIILRDGITRPAAITVVKKNKVTTLLEVTLTEGRNRQIRRMCETVGMILIDLQRIKFGPISLGTLSEEESRPLTINERQKLSSVVETESTK